jgi:hypothetical protein
LCCVGLTSATHANRQALSEHCEYYRWIRVQWAEAPYKLPGGGNAGEPERSGDASWGRALVIRTGLVLAALATPLSFHNAVWKFQARSRPFGLSCFTFQPEANAWHTHMW